MRRKAVRDGFAARYETTPIRAILEKTNPGGPMRDPNNPMTGSIICGVDGTAVSKGAVGVARDLGALLERRVVFVQVVAPSTAREEVDTVAERLQQLAEAQAGPEHAALWLVDVGHPADRLVAAAEDEKASLLIVGSHGPRSSLLGSISADVSRRAPCPVVVVPMGVDGITDAVVAADDPRVSASLAS
jgi:nucleotide-binding universal stress UspA family protein